MSKYFKEENSEDSLKDSSTFNKVSTYIQAINDKIQYFKYERWGAAGAIVFIYVIRLIITGGYHAVTYCLGIHLLNAFIGFISPLEDPDEEGTEDEGSFLPQKNSEEFRPFQRKIKEFQFWNVVFWSFCIGFLLTFNKDFNVPVYWPLLLIYFVLIFVLTMRKQINHMLKYNYLPWDAGKAKYGISQAK